MRRPVLLLSLAALCLLLACVSAMHGNPRLSMRQPRPAPELRRPGAGRLTQRELVRGAIDPSGNESPVMAFMTPPARPPRAVYESHWDVQDFHSSGGYDAEMSGVVDNARLYAASLPARNNSLWVFDVDETSLSGYEQMLSIGFGYVAKLNHEWILEASAPAIPQTLALFQQLRASGFKVAFLTGRPWDEADATALNLERAGFGGYETLLTRTPAEKNLTAVEYKSARRTQLVEKEGYDIVGCVGDQWSDIKGPYTGFKVKLPNYIYYLP